jgi:hypothetical protein
MNNARKGQLCYGQHRSNEQRPNMTVVLLQAASHYGAQPRFNYVVTALDTEEKLLF